MKTSRAKLLQSIAEMRLEEINLINEIMNEKAFSTVTLKSYLRSAYFHQIDKIYGVGVGRRIMETFSLDNFFIWDRGDATDLLTLWSFYDEDVDRGYIVDDSGTMLVEVMQFYRDKILAITKAEGEFKL